MKPKTHLFLYHLLWTADQLVRPTLRNLNGSFEAWAYRGGLSRQLAELERQQFVERSKSTGPNARIFRLTEQGRLVALGGRDPVARWSRPWDGRWRIIVFDVPMTQNKERQRLRRYLRSRSFGFVQGSVWITPDPLEQEVGLLRSSRVHVGSLLCLEANTCAGESDEELVAAAWDFERINAGYRRYMDAIETRAKGKGHSAALRDLAELEWSTWRDAVSLDPLLPRPLLPRNYLGEKAWNRRAKVFREMKRMLSSIGC
jgi:phenylacetic acid degradation operon negative regulatory protein